MKQLGAIHIYRLAVHIFDIQPGVCTTTSYRGLRVTMDYMNEIARRSRAKRDAHAPRDLIQATPRAPANLAEKLAIAALLPAMIEYLVPQMTGFLVTELMQNDGAKSTLSKFFKSVEVREDKDFEEKLKERLTNFCKATFKAIFTLIVSDKVDQKKRIEVWKGIQQYFREMFPNSEMNEQDLVPMILTIIGLYIQSKMGDGREIIS